MASEVDIANLALTDLGATLIVAMTDTSPNATTVNAVFDEVRDQVLAKHNWNFAAVRVELAQDITAPIFGFGKRFTLPANWLKTISVHDNSDGVGTAIYKTTGNFIDSDATRLWLYYVQRVEDPNLMTADFRRAFASALGLRIARKITDSNTIRAELTKQAAEDLAYAKSRDGQDGTPPVRPFGSWTTARFGSRSRSSGRW